MKGALDMQLGMIGLGRMGGSMVQRLLRGGHACVVFDSQSARVTSLAHDGATGSHSLDEFVRALDTPRAVWLMLPAAAVDTMLHELLPHLQPGDVVVDGGNSHYVDDIRRAKTLDATPFRDEVRRDARDDMQADDERRQSVTRQGASEKPGASSPFLDRAGKTDPIRM
jgi:NAD binding domain of 6-phosphogluconate dehydrogenase